MEQQQTQQQQQQQTKHKRCASCKTRLPGVALECRCTKLFCSLHLPAMEHSCTFDYRAAGRQLLGKQLDTSGLAEKVDKI